MTFSNINWHFYYYFLGLLSLCFVSASFAQVGACPDPLSAKINGVCKKCTELGYRLFDGFCITREGCSLGWRISQDGKYCEQGFPQPAAAAKEANVAKDETSARPAKNVRHELCTNQFHNRSTTGGAGASICRNRCQQAGLVFIPAGYGPAKDGIGDDDGCKRTFHGKGHSCRCEAK